MEHGGRPAPAQPDRQASCRQPHAPPRAGGLMLRWVVSWHADALYGCSGQLTAPSGRPRSERFLLAASLWSHSCSQLGAVVGAPGSACRMCLSEAGPCVARIRQQILQAGGEMLLFQLQRACMLGAGFGQSLAGAPPGTCCLSKAQPEQGRLSTLGQGGMLGWLDEAERTVPQHVQM